MLASLLPWANKSFTSHEGYRTSLVAARSAGQLGDRVATGAMVNPGQCIKQHVPNVVLNAKYLSNREMTALFIVVPATRK
jgi:hypothetical protein